MWDPPRPGLEPVSPTLAGRFSTTAPPGKPTKCGILKPNNYIQIYPRFMRENENSLPICSFNLHFQQTVKRKAKQVDTATTCVYWMWSHEGMCTLTGCCIHQLCNPTEGLGGIRACTWHISLPWDLATPLLTLITTLE